MYLKSAKTDNLSNDFVFKPLELNQRFMILRHDIPARYFFFLY